MINIHIYNNDFRNNHTYFVYSFLIDIVITPLIACCMSIFFVYRYYSLKNIASLKTKPFPFSFHIRAFCLFFICFFYIITLAFTASTHFLLFDYSDPYAIIISTFMAFIIFFQVLLLRFEFIKGVRMFWLHKFFWILILFVFCSNLIIDIIVINIFLCFIIIIFF